MRTTMKDIARECKVSVATVSIALSGSAKKGRISESKLEEIRQTARQLNYFPNSSASNLARGRSQTVGVVINDIRNSHIAELDTAISEVLQERGYKLEKACAVDMFPSTANCETIALLTRVK